jgi:hypothetical protein
MLAAILACVALAAAIVVALLRPTADSRRLRPLANVDRLTALPAYVRAVRIRTVTTVATLALLVVVFGGSVIAAARPTGLPTAAHQADSGQPEDVMVCAGAPVDDPAVKAALRYFAAYVPTLETARIGLTSANRRVIPLTRDHQWAAGRFGDYVSASGGEARASDFAPAVPYSDYAHSVEDVLALCLTGFPEFAEKGAQRRSVIYIGPETLRAPGETRPALFNADRLQAMAEAAGAQLNVLVTGPDGAALGALARATGGRSFPAQSGVAGHLAEIRDNPPPSNPDVSLTIKAATPDSPDIPLIVAILAVAALSLVPLVFRR